MKSKPLGLFRPLAAVSLAVLTLAALSWPSPSLAAPPANDNLASATTIASLPATLLGNNSEATAESLEPAPQCAAGNANRTVWFRYQATQTGWLVADTVPSSFDTVLQAFSGPTSNPTFGSLTLVACNDDGVLIGTRSRVRFAATGGTTYYFQVGAFGTGAGGDLTFNLASDLDNDQVNDPVDNCPATANGPAEASVLGVGNQTDSDGDGVNGTQPPPNGGFGGDACDADDDNDSVPDSSEWPGCRTLAEDYDGFQDTDGCPDPDNDQDGICDPGQTAASCSGSDSGRYLWQSPLPPPQDCRNVAEDFDAFHDSDGCPEPDNDYDGHPDSGDACPATDWTAGADGIADTGDEPLTTNLVAMKTREDYDGVIDGDGCHDSPEDDYDGDSFGVLSAGLPIFRDEREALFLGTNPMQACALTPSADDEPAPDAWPFDFNDDQRAGLTDVLAFIPVFGSQAPNPPYNPRFDYNADGRVNLNDILLFIPVINTSCVR